MRYKNKHMYVKQKGLINTKVKHKRELKYIYLIHAYETNLYKIGAAYDINQRLSTLSVSSPYPLKIVFTTSKPIQNWKELEKIIHSQLKDKNTNGEWFKLTDTDLVILAKVFELV